MGESFCSITCIYYFGTLSNIWVAKNRHKTVIVFAKIGVIAWIDIDEFLIAFQFFIKISCMVWPKHAVLIALRLLKLSYMEVIGNLMSI